MAQVVNNPPANTGDVRDALIPDLERPPWRRKWQPTPVFLFGKFHGQRSLGGLSPWGYKESDMTEQISIHTQVANTDFGTWKLCVMVTET